MLAIGLILLGILFIVVALVVVSWTEERAETHHVDPAKTAGGRPGKYQVRTPLAWYGGFGDQLYPPTPDHHTLDEYDALARECDRTGHVDEFPGVRL